MCYFLASIFFHPVCPLCDKWCKRGVGIKLALFSQPWSLWSASHLCGELSPCANNNTVNRRQGGRRAKFLMQNLVSNGILVCGHDIMGHEDQLQFLPKNKKTTVFKKEKFQIKVFFISIIHISPKWHDDYTGNLNRQTIELSIIQIGGHHKMDGMRINDRHA